MGYNQIRGLGRVNKWGANFLLLSHEFFGTNFPIFCVRHTRWLDPFLPEDLCKFPSDLHFFVMDTKSCGFHDILMLIIHFLCRMAFGYAYPAYECFKTVEMNKPDIEQLRFWCQYWYFTCYSFCHRYSNMETLIVKFVCWKFQDLSCSFDSLRANWWHLCLMVRYSIWVWKCIYAWNGCLCISMVDCLLLFIVKGSNVQWS